MRLSTAADPGLALLTRDDKATYWPAEIRLKKHSNPDSQALRAMHHSGNGSAFARWPCKQRNDRQEPPSLPRAKARSSCNYLHGTPICSTQFLHRPIMSIFTEQYQYNTGLPSSVQHDGVGCMTELAALII